MRGSYCHPRVDNDYLNTYSTDIRDMAGNMDTAHLVGFCSSSVCAKQSTVKRGVPVIFHAKDKADERCPRCNTPIITYEKVPDIQIERMRNRANH